MYDTWVFHIFFVCLPPQIVGQVASAFKDCVIEFIMFSAKKIHAIGFYTVFLLVFLIL